MALFQFKWLRRFIRKNTNPIPVYRADFMKKRFALIYMLIAWNAFGIVCYMVYTGKSDWARYYGLKSEDEALMPPAQQWSQTLGIHKAKVYRFSGISKKYEYMLEDGQIVKEDNSTE